MPPLAQEVPKLRTGGHQEGASKVACRHPFPPLLQLFPQTFRAGHREKPEIRTDIFPLMHFSLFAFREGQLS